MSDVYNPLDKINIAKSVAEALLDKAPEPLGGLKCFEGAGIYAIYYHGAFRTYRKMAERNRRGASWPIYIGKAVPAGARKGGSLFSEIRQRAVFARLREHADSVSAAATTLSVGDFSCRYLCVDDIWIPLGESLLITHFRPVWNIALDGFGNHDPGSGRYSGKIPLWDVLHPGRAWAANCKPRPESASDVAKIVAAFLSANEPDDRIRFTPSPRLSVDEIDALAKAKKIEAGENGEGDSL